MPSWTPLVTAGTGEGVALVGIWYAERRAPPVAPRDLKVAIRASGGMSGGHIPSPGSVSLVEWL